MTCCSKAPRSGSSRLSRNLTSNNSSSSSSRLNPHRHLRLLPRPLRRSPCSRLPSRQRLRLRRVRSPRRARCRTVRLPSLDSNSSSSSSNNSSNGSHVRLFATTRSSALPLWPRLLLHPRLRLQRLLRAARTTQSLRLLRSSNPSSPRSPRRRLAAPTRSLRCPPSRPVTATAAAHRTALRVRSLPSAIMATASMPRLPLRP